VPEVLETLRGRARMDGRVLRVAVPEVVLDRAQNVPLVGQRIAAGVAQHVRMDPAEPGTLADAPHQAADTLARELVVSLGDDLDEMHLLSRVSGRHGPVDRQALGHVELEDAVGIDVQVGRVDAR